MVRKLIKPWNALPAGAGVTLDPAEQVALIDPERLVHLEKDGHLEPLARATLREIHSEVRSGDDRHLVELSLAARRPLGRAAIAPPAEEPPPLPGDPAKDGGDNGEAVAPLRSLADRLATSAESVAVKVSPADHPDDLQPPPLPDAVLPKGK